MHPQRVHSEETGSTGVRIRARFAEWGSGEVGVNKYATGEEEEVELHEYNEAWAEEKITGLKELRSTRSSQSVVDSLRNLERVAREGGNVMYPLVECCKAYATVGEMSDVFKDVFGEFAQPALF